MLAKILKKFIFAAEQEKKLAMVRYQIGLIHLNNKQWHRAQKEFSRALILAPENKELRNLIDKTIPQNK